MGVEGTIVKVVIMMRIVVVEVPIVVLIINISRVYKESHKFGVLLR